MQVLLLQEELEPLQQSPQITLQGRSGHKKLVQQSPQGQEQQLLVPLQQDPQHQQQHLP